MLAAIGIQWRVMPQSARARLGAAIVLVCASVPTAACQSDPLPQPPTIEFSIVPPASGGGPNKTAPIAGRVTNAQLGDAIVLFAKTRVWWVQPFRSNPFTTIADDFSWQTNTHLGIEYAAL